MIRKKNAKRSNSAFSREFSSLARKFQELSTADWRQAVDVRKKIYDLLTAAVLKHKPKKLEAAEVDQIIDFMRRDTSAEDNDEFSRAVTLLDLLHKEGNIAATTILADIYSTFMTEPPVIYRKRSRALLLYEQVSKSPDPVYAGYAHCRLAQLHAYFSGAGEIDGLKYSDLARRHIDTSAYELESPFGLVILGCWHYDGEIVEKDWKKCHDLLKRAHEIVKDEAWDECWIKWETYFQYGYVVRFGQGCATEGQRGTKLMREAAANGNHNAIEWLKNNDDKDTTGGAAAVGAGSGEKKDENPMAYFAQNRKKRGKVKTKKELEKMLKPLHALIGCTPVKREIESLIYLAHANALRQQKKIDTPQPALHAAFLGAPGTGKTTVARMYGQLLHELGFLTSGHLVEATRADMIAEWIGQTAPKVRAMVEKAVGGVLFIDEAYSIVPDDDFRDFGPEAVAELIQQMENRRDNFVVVFAGYTDKMKMFLKSNPGLKSRVPSIIEFPDYSVDEMLEIFKKFAADSNFTLAADALPPLAAYLKKLDRESIRRMGNARGIRNIFEDTLIRQARRIVHEGKTTKRALMRIERQDIHLPGDPGKGIFTVIDGKK